MHRYPLHKCVDDMIYREIEKKDLDRAGGADEAREEAPWLAGEDDEKNDKKQHKDEEKNSSS